jgi:hypothetical protein
VDVSIACNFETIYAITRVQIMGKLRTGAEGPGATISCHCRGAGQEASVHISSQHIFSDIAPPPSHQHYFQIPLKALDFCEPFLVVKEGPSAPSKTILISPDRKPALTSSLDTSHNALISSCRCTSLGSSGQDPQAQIESFSIEGSSRKLLDVRFILREESADPLLVSDAVV